jgi:DNA-binding GntR family transcriptional regulator
LLSLTWLFAERIGNTDAYMQKISAVDDGPNAEATVSADQPRKMEFSPFSLDALAQENFDLKTDTTQNRAYIALKNAVLAGKFYPGTVVTLRKLSEMLGTSEMPIREALKRLTAEGAFEALPNRSARVPTLSRHQMNQILELRVDLESKAAAQATEYMTKRHIDQLTALETRMEEALENNQLSLYVSLNKEFHFLIYRTADNEPLLALIEALWLRMAPVVAFNLTAAENASERYNRAGRAHHFEIINAFQTRDAAKASQEIRADLLHPTTLSEYRDAPTPSTNGVKASTKKSIK